MDQARTALQKGNPLRADIGWQVVLAEEIVAIGIGIYAILAESSAQETSSS